MPPPAFLLLTVLSSRLIPDLTLSPSHPLLSPYWIPLCGSSGSISPSSIFVRIILASRLNNSSTFSPDNADTSTDTGIADRDAHLEAISGVTSLPSAFVAVSLEPGRLSSPRDLTELPASKGSEDCLLDILDGVRFVSGVVVELVSARSTLFPATMTVKFGEPSALASMRNVGSALKDVKDATS